MKHEAWTAGALLCVVLVGCGGDGASPGTGGSGPQTSGGSAAGAQAGSMSSSGSGGAPASGGRGGGQADGGTATGGGALGGSSSGGTTAAGGGGSGAATAGAASGGSMSAGGAGHGGAPPVIAAGVRWVGRVDVQDPAKPRFGWSGTGFVGTLSGDTISVKLSSAGDTQPIFFQPVVDGKKQTRVSVSSADGEKTVTLATGLGAGDHRVELYRETEGKPGFASSTFLGFVSGTAKAPPEYSGRLIEVIGDSISAGYGNLGTEQHPNGSADPSGGCHFTTDTESAYMAYGAVAARALDADASIVAGSGWGIYSDNGGNKMNVMPNVWTRTIGSDDQSMWSFAPVPQAVVINLGTNDFSADMNLGSAEFSGAYSSFITKIRAKYPDAFIFCAVGPMLYGTGLTNATSYIKAVVEAQNKGGDAKVKMLDFGSQDASKGTGCDWHPSVAENQRLADKLTQELKTALGW